MEFVDFPILLLAYMSIEYQPSFVEFYSIKIKQKNATVPFPARTKSIWGEYFVSIPKSIDRLLSRYLSLHFNIPTLEAIARKNKLSIEILFRCAHRIYGSCYSGRECFPYFNRKSNTLLKMKSRLSWNAVWIFAVVLYVDEFV